MSDATKVRVSGKNSSYEHEIVARQHLMVADEPVDYGGTDRGPTPYEFLLASLGS